MIPQLYTVTGKSQDNADTFTLTAKSDNGQSLSFQPGQFNMLYVFGKGEIPISISGPPADTEQLIHTVESVGAVSKALVELEPGQSFGVRGPYGQGWPVEKAHGKDLIIMAGGLGLAPLRPVVYDVLANRDRFGRVVLLYGTRNVERLIFEEEIREWRQRLDIDIMVTLDMASPSWHGHVGVVTGLCRAAGMLMDIPKAVAFVCGPDIMMRFSARELRKLGMEKENIYVSIERNMKCALGHCGHCQFGPHFLCKDGPVLSYETLEQWLKVREL